MSSIQYGNPWNPRFHFIPQKLGEQQSFFVNQCFNGLPVSYSHSRNINCTFNELVQSFHQVRRLSMVQVFPFTPLGSGTAFSLNNEIFRTQISTILNQEIINQMAAKLHKIANKTGLPVLHRVKKS
jgi:hypothetical protein